MTLYLRTLLAISSFALIFPSFGAGDIFPLPARLLGDGTAGTTAGSRGDFMLPLFGSERGMVYGGLQGKYYRHDSWFGGIAGGFRQTFGSNIFGGYVFADHNESTSNKRFFSLNPGIEGMNAQWDAHLNGYFPVGSRSKIFSSVWADEVGDYRFVSFSEHKQFDHLFVDTETAGRGIDAEVGYRVLPLNNLRLALGGYYFNFKEMNDMRGIIGTVEYPFNDRVTLLAQDSYDNLHDNTFMLTVRLRFGAINPQEGRMLDPVRRNLGTLDKGTSIPTERAWIDNGANLVEKDHIWFFKPGGENFDAAKGLSNCTAEHPCTSTELTQSEIDTISALDPIDTLDLATGTYLLDPTESGRIRLNQGQSIDGRTLDFKKPAYGEERAKLIGGLDSSGNNEVSNIILDNQILDSALPFSQEFQLFSLQPRQNVGMTISGRTILRNDYIGTARNSNTYTLGVDIISQNGARNVVSIIDSAIFATNTNSRTITGLRANNTNLVLLRSAVIARATNFPAQAPLPMVATSMELNGRTVLDMFNSTLGATATTTNTSLVPVMVAQAIALNDTSDFSISGLSRFNIVGEAGINNLTLIQAMGINNNSAILNTGLIRDTRFNIQAIANIGTAGAWGIRQPADRQVTLINVDFERTARGTPALGQNVGP